MNQAEQNALVPKPSGAVEKAARDAAGFLRFERDRVAATYRGHGHALALGVDPQAFHRGDYRGAQTEFKGKHVPPPPGMVVTVVLASVRLPEKASVPMAPSSISLRQV